MMWKYGFASVVGTAHGKAALSVQDASHAEIIRDPRGNEVLIAVASDGAGSAAQAQTGSQLACDLFVKAVKPEFTRDDVWQQLTEHFIADWIERFQQTIRQAADEANLKAPDFACTLLAAIIGSEGALYFQLGDGAMVVAPRDEPEQYCCVC